EETDLVLAQKFLPTEFDWRGGGVAGGPPFGCPERVGRGGREGGEKYPHGAPRRGGVPALRGARAPPRVVHAARPAARPLAARPIGEGFYGVDLKQTDRGIVVMEVNDNPNLEHGIEDQVGKDEIWTKLLKWFIERFEQ